MANTRTIGLYGEDFARKWLEQNGHTILCQNYRHDKYEIDIITQKQNTIHFVEVKIRSSARFGYPEQWVDATKLDRIKSAAQHYLLSHVCDAPWISYDIIALLYTKTKDVYDVLFLEDVF